MRLPSEQISGRALVLRLIPYRDSDRVVHLYTEPIGKVAALARGARKSQRRFSGALQPFTVLDAELRLRETAGMADLVSARPVRAFSGLAVDPGRLGRAGYLCELVEVLTRERDPQPGLLDLLIEALALLAGSEIDTAALLRAFEVNLLTVVGVWPDHRSCAGCGALFDVTQDVALREGVEGVVCGDCGGEPLPPGTIARLVPGPLALALREPISSAVARAVGRLTTARIRALAPRPLRSIAFLKQLEIGDDPSP